LEGSEQILHEEKIQSIEYLTDRHSHSGLSRAHEVNGKVRNGSHTLRKLSDPIENEDGQRWRGREGHLIVLMGTIAKPATIFEIIVKI
jgi:hypothetical protein